MLVWEKFKQKEEYSLFHAIFFFDVSCVCFVAVYFSIFIFLFGPFESAEEIRSPLCFIATHTSQEQTHRLTQAHKAHNLPFSGSFPKSPVSIPLSLALLVISQRQDPIQAWRLYCHDSDVEQFLCLFQSFAVSMCLNSSAGVFWCFLMGSFRLCGVGENTINWCIPGYQAQMHRMGLTAVICFHHTEEKRSTFCIVQPLSLLQQLVFSGELLCCVDSFVPHRTCPS